MNKIIVIGIDGADNAILDSLLKEGRLPNIKKIAERGYRAYLKSTLPPLTIPAWPAMFSGKDSLHLDAFDFFRIENDYKLSYLSSRNWQDDMLWKICGDAGLKCALLDVPGTNPAYPVNGMLFSSSFGNIEAFPPSLEKEAAYKRFKKSVNGFQKALTDKGIIEASGRELRESANLAKFILQKEWDIFVWVIRLADVSMHRGGLSEMKEAYANIDRELALFIDYAQENNCSLFITSDHGYAEAFKSLNINAFLEQLGCLKFKRSLYNIAARAQKTAGRLKRAELFLYRFARNIKKIPAPSSPELIRRNIDFKKSRAFSLTEICHGSPGVWINSSDNFKEGPVSPGQDKETLIEELKKNFLSLEDEAGAHPVKEVILRRELSKNAPHHMPDMFLMLEEGYSPGTRPHREIISSNHKFIHGPNGILIAYGAQISGSGGAIKNAGITDIAPTILHLLGESIPDDLNGRVLYEIFESSSLYFNNKARYHKSAKSKLPNRADYVLREKEEKIIRERLKKLGYI
ncbi:MAG: alkaline phosphatase family protein [Candidatus Omnitrophica bacterium]|nr:alkaline phosphatase family protein [Candidatus Omnitrophota bacterium]